MKNHEIKIFVLALKKNRHNEYRYCWHIGWNDKGFKELGRTFSSKEDALRALLVDDECKSKEQIKRDKLEMEIQHENKMENS